MGVHFRAHDPSVHACLPACSPVCVLGYACCCRLLLRSWACGAFSLPPLFQVYNTILKVVFLTAAYAIIYLMRNQLKHTYDKENDTFRMIFCVVPCFILACFVNYYPNPQEVRASAT